MADQVLCFDDENTCGDASSICSMDVAEMMKGFTLGRPYESPQATPKPVATTITKTPKKHSPTQSPTKSPVAVVVLSPKKKDESPKNNNNAPAINTRAAGGYESDELENNYNNSDSLGGSWEFDLGPLKLEVERAHNNSNNKQPTTSSPRSPRNKSAVSKTSFAEETTSRTTGITESDDEVDEDSLDGDASIALGQILAGFHANTNNNTKKPPPQHMMNPHQSIVSSCDNFFYQDSVCSEALTVNAMATRLEERRAARAARMEKVRQRIAREKEQAKQRQQAEQWQNELAQSTPEAKRQRMYEWYTRLGLLSRKELKKRVKLMPASAKVSVEDVDLLPWNFNGTSVNVSKLTKMGVSLRPTTNSTTSK